MTDAERAALDAMDTPDPTEIEYLRAIDRARSADEFQDLVIGLRQYRELYKATS